MNRPWLAHYPPELPAEIDPDRYPSVNHLFDEAFGKFGARPYAVCMERFMTYAEFERLSRAFGGWLQSRGLTPGARVAIMLPNVLQFPVAMAGVLRAGYTVVTVNPLYTPRELEHQLRDSGAEAIVVLENFAHVLAQVLPKVPIAHVVVSAMGDLFPAPKRFLVDYVVRRVKKLVPPFELPGSVPFRTTLRDGARHPFAQAQRGGDDIAFLQYTGGTTGLSKGAIITHRNVVAAMLQFDAALQVTLGALPEPPPQVNIVTALPLYHSYALTACGLLAMRQGHLLTLIPNPRDIPAFVEGAGQAPLPHAAGPEHAVHGARPRTRTSASSTSRSWSSPAPAAWRRTRRWPTAGRRSPAASSAKAGACRRRPPPAR